MKQYIADSDVFIALYDNLPMHTYESPWEKFTDYIKDGRIIICETVFNEIKKAEELKAWLNQFKDLIKPCLDKDVLLTVKEIVNSFPKLIDINNSGDQSDPYIIAIAKLNSYTVLSEETYSEAGKKTKIPFVCKQLTVDCVDLRKFYEQERWKF